MQRQLLYLLVVLRCHQGALSCFPNVVAQAIYPPTNDWTSVLILERPHDVRGGRFRVRFTSYPQYCTNIYADSYSVSGVSVNCLLAGSQIRTSEGVYCVSYGSGGTNNNDIKDDGENILLIVCVIGGAVIFCGMIVYLNCWAGRSNNEEGIIAAAPSRLTRRFTFRAPVLPTRLGKTFLRGSTGFDWMRSSTFGSRSIDSQKSNTKTAPA
eukprot:GEMP01058855.1.p1 GENE.GEMP01058855.1~~GEMP01058855.1.p1  ORF type:complete len:210 (+),score=31.72 GEMP01058855.1:58-687(+)